MPIFNNLCGNLCKNDIASDGDFKVDVKLKLNTITTDIKSIEKDIMDFKGEMIRMTCDMRIEFGNLNNKLDILISRKN